MSVCAVIPYAPSSDHRNGLFDFTYSYLENLGLDVIIGSADNSGGPASFNHPRAINAGVAQTSADVVMVVDADTVPVLPHGTSLETIFEQVGDGHWAWAMPFNYKRLTEAKTASVLTNPSLLEHLFPCDFTWSGATSWAGVQVARRESLLKIGGWDERFEFWGADDVCFGLAMDSLVGPHVRFDGSAIHLWHPQPAVESHLHENWGTQFELTERYMSAAGDSAVMAIIKSEDSP